MADLQFSSTAAANYDQVIGRLTRPFVPALLHAARLAPAQRVLDIATGTGLAAEAAAEAVGPAGHVAATDISPAMIERARQRLGRLPNVSFEIQDGQALTHPPESCDAVLCNMGLMYFPDPARGLSEFRRVLRHGGRAAVSVSTTPERSLSNRVLAVIGRHVSAKAAEAARMFSLGEEAHLCALFEAAGFVEVESRTETLRATFPSFDAFFAGIEEGAGNSGQEYTALPEALRRVVREQMRRELKDDGGPLEAEVEVRIAGGRR
ncbi:methyltransferase domain-containing protein [Falsiroseomonas sp.]|uniref:methyltransferase domain-containing protein n=1 Tax=Falsiroseomonas sp. TaxID=2870721 RepID=UPI0035654A2A